MWRRGFKGLVLCDSRSLSLVPPHPLLNSAKNSDTQLTAVYLLLPHFSLRAHPTPPSRAVLVPEPAGPHLVYPAPPPPSKTRCQPLCFVLCTDFSLVSGSFSRISKTLKSSHPENKPASSSSPPVTFAFSFRHPESPLSALHPSLQHVALLEASAQSHPH